MSTAKRCEHTTHPTWAIVVFLSACGSKPASPSLPTDPAAASVQVRTIATSCDGLTRALDMLGTSGFTGRPLVGLVDDALGAPCSDREAAASGTSVPAQLAQARLADARPAVALGALVSATEPAIALRRAELLDRLGRTAEARDAIALALAFAPDVQAASDLALYTVSIAARAGLAAEVSERIAGAPVPARPALAHRAIADAAPALLLAFTAPVELVTAAAERIEQTSGPAASVRLRERAAVLTPEDADAWDALARGRLASGNLDGAVAAWDRAIAIAPAQPLYRTAPVAALALAGQREAARARVLDLQAQARAHGDVELAVTASAAASTLEPTLALALAREALALRPSDGRLVFLVGQREAEAKDALSAARTFTRLLVCGAHGRAWHRHEVAAKLLELGAVARRVIDEDPGCPAVEAADLAPYRDSLRGAR